MTSVQEYLFKLQDLDYKDFNGGLLPTVDKDAIIGVRVPLLRKYARELVKNGKENAFLSELPHVYFEENMLHSIILSKSCDFEDLILKVEQFLPFVDNWAVCDCLTPTVFKNHRYELLACINRWLVSEEEYTLRFAVKMLMEHFLDEDFDNAYLRIVANLPTCQYYVKMMVAWYFATALAKQYDEAIKLMEERAIPRQTHNKAIQKAIESYRITNEQKVYLKSLRY